MAPPVGVARPSSRRARVVLPEPLSPTTAMIEGSSASIARDSPASARVLSRPSPPAKRLLTSTASISAAISSRARRPAEFHPLPPLAGGWGQGEGGRQGGSRRRPPHPPIAEHVLGPRSAPTRGPPALPSPPDSSDQGRAPVSTLSVTTHG